MALRERKTKNKSCINENREREGKVRPLTLQNNRETRREKQDIEVKITELEGRND